MVKWTAAVIAGGGVAGLTQGVTAMLRAKSTVFTGGLGNFVISTAELGGAVLFQLLALAAPVAALILVRFFLLAGCSSVPAAVSKSASAEGSEMTLGPLHTQDGSAGCVETPDRSVHFDAGFANDGTPHLRFVADALP